MVPESGYWRTDYNSTKFEKCVNEDACLGSPTNDESTLYYTGKCDTGYKDNLCSTCDATYFKVGMHTCAQCLDNSGLIPLHIVIISAYCLFITISIRSTLQDSKKGEDDGTGVLFRVLMNNLQGISLVPSFQLQWPALAVALFEIFGYVNQGTSHAFSFS
jgi:hypothetical protein